MPEKDRFRKISASNAEARLRLRALVAEKESMLTVLSSTKWHLAHFEQAIASANSQFSLKCASVRLMQVWLTRRCAAARQHCRACHDCQI
jgi:hypothetical protein